MHPRSRVLAIGWLLTGTAVSLAATPDAGPPRTHASTERRIRINDQALTDAQRRTLEQVERTVGRIYHGEYW